MFPSCAPSSPHSPDFDPKKAVKARLVEHLLAHPDLVPQDVAARATSPAGPGAGNNATFVTEDQLRAMGERFAAMVTGTDDRLDRMDSALEAILARLDSREGNEPASAAGNAAGVPTRGPHGELPPPSVRYSYLDPKVRDEVMAGAFRHDRLGSLLPDTSPLSRGISDDEDQLRFTQSASGAIVLAPRRAAGQALVQRFMKEIPTPVVFAAAWTVFTDLFLQGLRSYDAGAVCDAHAALQHHLLWMLERFVDFEWEGLCSYHIRVADERFAAGFSVNAWYKAVDVDLWTRLQVRRSAPAALGPGSPSRSSKAGGVPICNNFNLGLCKDTACTRRHVCRVCKKAGHPVGSPDCQAKATA